MALTFCSINAPCISARSCTGKPLKSALASVVTARPSFAGLAVLRNNCFSGEHSTNSVHSGRGSLQVYAAASAASTVKIIIQGRHVEVTDAIKAHVEEKVGHSLAFYEGSVKSVDVKLSVRGGDRGVGAKEQKTEITVYTLRNGVIRAEDVESSLYASIDLVCDKLSRKMRKVKEKAIQRGKWPGHGGPRGEKITDELVADEEAESQEIRSVETEFPPEILRVKKTSLTPMSVSDALDQAEQLGHDFFVFLNKADDDVQVIYKRKDGGFGLIQPTQ
jgi:ribosomal subunit interface protein